MLIITTDFIKKLNSILSGKDKIFLLFLFIFSVFVAIMETFAISIIMPFIAVAVNFKMIQENKYFHYFYHLFNFSSTVYFVATFGILLIIFYIFRGAINIIYYFFLGKFSAGRYHNIAYRLFSNYMSMSYMQFINSNTSELSKAIVTEAYNLTIIINSFLLLISEIFVAIFIYFILLYVNWGMTILLTAFLAFNVLFLIKTVSSQIKKSGEKREKFQLRFYKILNSSFGNFKLIKLKSKEKNVLNNFFESSVGFASANIKNLSLTNVPKYLLEAIGFSLVSFFVVYSVLKNHADIRNILPLISIFILGLYRLLPSANRILSNYNLIIFLNKSLDIVHKDIYQISEELGDDPVELNEQIVLKDISFGYVENKPILKNINMTIKKGERIAITGETGSGKSTLVDLIIGLLKPDKGEIFIDGVMLNNKNIKSWRNKSGYIPQTIYLFDGTVAQNIVIGEDTIDEDKVREVLKKANMLDFLEKHHEGIYTKVGEGGIKLSGGQKQRVAIARALYDDPDILVLDEATSSLDNKTESQVMEEIYEAGKDKTLIIIAHRLFTIERCDKIYNIEEGSLKLQINNLL